MQVKHRELHRITSTAIIVKPLHQSFGSEGKDGKFLIVKRSPTKKAFPNMWTVPGGGLEVDDYINTPKTTSAHWYFGIENSLKREIREEVGLEVGRLNYLLDIVFIKPDGTPCIILSFYCHWKSGEVRLNEENIGYKWVSFEEAKHYQLVPGLLGELEMVDKILKGEDIEQIEYKDI